jgi:hypothetical protein
MPGPWKTMRFFALSLPNRPGELACFAAQLRDAGINLLGLWAFETTLGAEEARVACVPDSPAAFRRYFQDAGIEMEEGTTFYITEMDTPGVLLPWLQKIAENGINLESVECVACGGQFGCFVWVEPERVKDLVRVTGAE